MGSKRKVPNLGSLSADAEDAAGLKPWQALYLLSRLLRRTQAQGDRMMRGSTPEAAGGADTLTTATMEPVARVMRLHRGTGHHTYVAHSSVSVDCLGCATLRGFSIAGFTTRDWRAVLRVLGAAGIKEMIYTRKTPGGSRLVRVAPKGASDALVPQVALLTFG
jgi:hypothetical protein